MHSLDRTDREIVRLLQEDARRSNKDLAASVGIADSTCSTRLRRLEDAGTIRGYRADIDPEAMGVGLQAMVSVRLLRHTNDAIAELWNHVGGLAEAIGTYHLTGQNDFLIHLVVADADHLREVTSSVLASWAEVARLETSVIFEHRRARLPDLTGHGRSAPGGGASA